MDALTDFLASDPTPEQILAYKLPEALELRTLDLLERNRDNRLSSDEREEMEAFKRMGHFMNMQKLKVRLKMIDTFQLNLKNADKVTLI